MNKAYFANYCGYGPYAEHYLYHSGIVHCIQIVERLELQVSSVFVLGTATGEVLKHFEEEWGIRPSGCEVSRWAYNRIPIRYRKRVCLADMRRLVPKLVAHRQSFDLVFSNSLMYLPVGEMGSFLGDCSRICSYFHYQGSTAEDYEAGDVYRVTLQPYKWWNQTFKANGFSRTRSKFLWRSERRGDFRCT